MSGAFASLNTALSALRFNRVAMDTASQNIANVGVEGYTRRRVESASAGTPTTPAMWSRSQNAGGGVRVVGVARMTDAFVDARLRTESGRQSYLAVRQDALQRFETTIGEPGPDGVAAVMGELRRAWGDLANHPTSDATRATALASASELAIAVRTQAANIAEETSTARQRLLSVVAEVNTAATELAATNKAIAVTRIDGSDAGNLLDRRDLLALRLSQLTGGTATANTSGGMDVTVQGTALVTGAFAGELSVAGGVTPTGDPDGGPITFAIDHPLSGPTAVPSGMRGEAGALTDLVDTTFPAYRAGLDAVAAQLADGINALHATGFDAAGNPGGAVFSYDPADPSGSLQVALTDTAQLAPAAVAGSADGSIADRLAELTGPEGSYQRLVTGFGSTVASGARLLSNQTVITEQVNGTREQLAGVSLDEEMLSMVEYQRAYEAAARVLTTVDSMLDTLINRTGVTR